jgi:hypothetical protein
MAASAHKGFELAGYERQYFKKIVGRLDCGVNDNFAGQRYTSDFLQQCEGKARAQSKIFLLIPAPAGEA